MKLTITIKHEKTTKNYEKYASSNPLATLYIPKEEFDGKYGPNAIPRQLSVVVTDEATRADS